MQGIFLFKIILALLRVLIGQRVECLVIVQKLVINIFRK